MTETARRAGARAPRRRRGADEGALETRMGDRFVGADKTGAELNPGRSQLEVGQHCLAPPDPAGDEDRHLHEVRQHLLGEDRGRYRPDMTAGLAALDDDRLGPHAHEFFRDPKWRKARPPPSPEPLDRCCAGMPLARRRTGYAGRRHHQLGDAASYQMTQRLIGQRRGGGDLHVERPAASSPRRSPKTTGIEIAATRFLSDTGHRPPMMADRCCRRACATTAIEPEAQAIGSFLSAGPGSLSALGCGRLSLIRFSLSGSSSPYAVCGARSSRYIRRRSRR